MTIYKFRNCFLHETERRVVQNGVYLELTPKTIDVLLLLIKRAGEIVTKDDILGEVWNGSFVEEGNLPVHISKLRRSLGESRTETFIETVQGSGYRFVAPVTIVPEQEWQQNLPPESQNYKDPSSADSNFDSIAVLPLENETDDPEIEYLTDGLTESFINILSRIPDLKVIGRNTVFRYKGKKADPVQVGQTLNISAVLTGRIRVFKGTIQISVELTKVSDSSQLWGNTFDLKFSDIIDVQEKIILGVSENLRSEIAKAIKNSLTNPITNNPESYRLYLMGKYLMEKRLVNDALKAISCFEKSVCFDPINVYSYSAIVECYIWLLGIDYLTRVEALGKITPILSVISQLNQSFDLVQAMYGGVKMYLEWDFDEAKKHLLIALKLNPNCLFALYRYSYILTTTGYFSESLKVLQQLLYIDPISLLTYKRIGKVFYKMGRQENAIVYLNDALELEKNDWEAQMILASSLTELGRYKEAITIFEKCLTLNYDFEALSMIGYANALEGNKEKAYEIINQINSNSKTPVTNSIKLAKIYGALNEKDMAFKYLESAYQQHEIDLTSLISDPRWKSIADDPRFVDLAKRIGFKIL
ncbi:MAG: winged helix-turn-helix domain-containing protein [Acidobacteria bacterium]|nr:winged helix-turn-helix domain-containing protein [Acidobacteriota bacterium]